MCQPLRRIRDFPSHLGFTSTLPELELDEQCAHPLLVWDFPASIKLIGLDSSDNEVECYYDIVGRAFFSPSSNHFTCSIADFDGQCYEYDDTAHCGMLTLVGDIAPFAAVAGKDNPTSRQARQNGGSGVPFAWGD